MVKFENDLGRVQEGGELNLLKVFVNFWREFT